MARVSGWVATLPGGEVVRMGTPRTVAELVGPYRLDVQTEDGRAVHLDVRDGQRAQVFTRVMRRYPTGEELTVPVVELQGVRTYLHPDGDVVTTEDLYW